MTQADSGATLDFSEDEISEFEARSIALSSGDRRSALQLADSWAVHVDKIDRDRALSWTDRTVWNEYDFSAAIIIRDYLSDAMRNLVSPLSGKVLEYVANPDERYRAITVGDSGMRMAAVSRVEVSGRGWWWYRVPDSGPVLEDLARWDRFDPA
ncbi:hypothetical protein [Nocardia callitridis]|uniref:SnoaL-like domain-containing protein n=1 Tax=Nocardia callitridis TaxID=648753 RepID=A0ABP9KWT9_9NOCA